MWTCNLFKKQRDVANTDNANNKTDYNNDLIGGWYGVDSKLSCFLPVLAFEKNHIVTFSDGRIVKEYDYHICCSTCIILTAKDGEKIFVKMVLVKGKPHLFYNEQAFTRDGKHSEWEHKRKNSLMKYLFHSIMLALLFVGGCSNKPQSTNTIIGSLIVGKWQMIEYGGGYVNALDTISFYENGNLK